MNESRLTGNIVKTIHRAYPSAWTFKVHGSSYQMAGVPDLLVCVHGLLVGLEVKLPQPGESVEHAKARATPSQRVQIARINGAGGIAAVVTSTAEALALIERGLERKSLGEGKNHEQGQPDHG